MKYAILFNPLAGNDGGKLVKEELEILLNGNELIFKDITKTDVADFVKTLDKECGIIISGGDGTLNRFINTIDCDKLANNLYIYASGTGNDFIKDISENCEAAITADTPDNAGKDSGKLYDINDLVRNLPVVTVNGKDYKFLNGVGYGIDGYCCEVGDELKAAGKKVNYTSIAIKGLLFHFKPRNATVIVDGTSYHFDKVWIAPTMNGKYYGGGMIPTPAQDRNSENLSICLMYGAGKLKTLMTFPKIFKGEHVKKEKIVKVLEGKEITVKFDTPCALQIDGETILNVSSYTAKRNA